MSTLDQPAKEATSAPGGPAVKSELDIDAGPLITLRCAGPNGLFDAPALGDDLVCVAPLGPSEQLSIFVIRYRFPGVVPMFQRCRFYRGPAPAETNCP